MPRKKKETPTKDKIDKMNMGSVDWEKETGKTTDEMCKIARNYKEKSKRYTVSLESMIVLRKKGLTYSQIAGALKCSKDTVTKRLAPFRMMIDNTDDYKNARALSLMIQQHRISKAITDEKLDEAKLKDLAYAFGLFYDKERLETGQSTQNISYMDIVKARHEKEKELAALKKLGPSGFEQREANES